MTIAQMGDAIADACKWTRDYNTESDFLYRTADGRGMFNPAACLNAMHEAEKQVWGRDWGEYYRELCSVCKNPYADERAIFATAAQRAEAFLRILNLWKP